MAFSADEGKQFFKEWLKFFCMGGDGIRRILDIGPGAGIYADIARQVKPELIINAIEIYEPYVERFRLKEKYNNVIVGDAVALTSEIDHYDLIILGDVFEHVDGVTAANWWKEIKMKGRFIWLSLPVKPFRDWFWGYNQTEIDWEENPAERHLADWNYQVILDTLGPFLWQVPFRTVVVLIAEGKIPTVRLPKRHSIDEQKILKYATSAMYGPKGPEMLRTGNKAIPPHLRDIGLGWLLYGFTRVHTPKIVVEVGTGGSTFPLLQGLKDNDVGHLYTIDPFLTGPPCNEHGGPNDWVFDEDGKPLTLEHAHFIRTAQRLELEEYYTFYHETSQAVGKRWNQPIDMLVVDGDHRGEAVKADWDNFSKWLKPGGYALFHDALGCMWEVTTMLQEQCGDDKEFSMLIEPDYLGMAIIQKKFTVDNRIFYFLGRLARPDNPQGATTPLHLSDASDIPGLITKWRGYIFNPRELDVPAHDEGFKAGEELIRSGKQQTFEQARKILGLKNVD